MATLCPHQLNCCCPPARPSVPTGLGFWRPSPLPGLCCLSSGIIHSFFVFGPRVPCIPVASGVVRAAVTARFARAFGTLLDNGIGLPSGLGHQSRCGRPPAVGGSGGRVLGPGQGRWVAGAAAGEFRILGSRHPGDLDGGGGVQRLSTGLGTAGGGLERRVEDRLALLMRLVEPILLLAMGGVVFFIFLSLVLPMLKMNSTVS